MTDISGQGIEINIIAIPSFPVGFTVNQFVDDSDPVSIADVQIAETAMGLNGDLLSWNKAVPIPMVISVIPGSDDDRNLAILTELNRVGRGKLSTKDTIIATIIYPNGDFVTLTNGKLTNAPMISSVTSAGRKKSKTYTFSFENKFGLGI